MSFQFICLKWGQKYSSDYVNRLYRMIRRQMTSEFTLYCLTDDCSGIYPEISILPIVDQSLTGWWHKLSLFQTDFHGLSGDLLFTDLDVVIVGRLEEFFRCQPGRFLITRDKRTGAYNSSVFRFRVGSQCQIWDSFQEHSELVLKEYYGDQDWITKTVKDAVLWPEGWVVSFKRECHARIPHSYGHIGALMRRYGLMNVTGEAVIPEGARIIQFHGKPDPDDVVDGPYDIYRSAPWIRNYW